jgi:hypothetical protein
MRYIIVIVFFLTPYLLKAQTYSTIISDDEIIGFINQDIQRDSVKAIRIIHREMFELFEDVFYFKDSTDYYYKNQNISTFIFRKHIFRGRAFTYYIDTIFTRQDIDYFLLQINGLKEKKFWKSNFINSRLFDDVKFDSNSRGELKHLDRFKRGFNNYPESVIYTYSLPLFSFDKRKAIIIKGFYCGLVCGGGGYYIYEKTNNNGWKLIGEINTWAE